MVFATVHSFTLDDRQPNAILQRASVHGCVSTYIHAMRAMHDQMKQITRDTSTHAGQRNQQRMLEDMGGSQACITPMINTKLALRC